MPVTARKKARSSDHVLRSNERFPHQSTGDQMYDEKQFEAYRGLGFLTMEEIIGPQKEGDIVKLPELIRDELQLLSELDPSLLRYVQKLFPA